LRGDQAGRAQPALATSFLSRKETRDNRYCMLDRAGVGRDGCFGCLDEEDHLRELLFRQRDGMRSPGVINSCPRL
jgi:hypothetical protein